MLTIHDKLVAGLKAMGCTVVKQRAGQGTELQKPNRLGAGYYFVGPSGGLRAGSNKSESISLLGSRLYGELVALGERRLTQETAK